MSDNSDRATGARSVTIRSPAGDKRIAMVAYTHYRTDPRCRREATLAAAAGWDVHFYALSRDGRARRSDVEGITLHELALDRYRGASSTAYLFSYLRFLLLAGWAVQRDHLRSRFAVVHVNTMPDFMVATALLPRLSGAKVVLDVHDVMPEIYMTKFALPADHWRIRVIRAMEVLSARCAHEVLTAEHPKAELLAAHGVPADKISVLLNLPDDSLFHLQYRLPDPELLRDDTDAGAREFRLIYHGTLARRLGLHRAVAALGLLRDELPGARLQLFGEGDQLPDLRRQVRELGLADRVWFSGRFLPIEQIIPEIQRAHLAILPTCPAVSTDYMLPTKLLEYLAFGIPALFTPTMTVRHYFPAEHPLYLDDPTPAGIAAKVLWVRRNYGEAKRLTAQLQADWFGRYHWPTHRRLYEELLMRLAGRERGEGEGVVKDR